MNGFEKTNESFENVGETGLQVVHGTTDTGESFILDLSSRQVSYCTMVAKTEEEQDVLFTAMNNPEKRIGDCINMEIEIKDVFIEVVYCETQDGSGLKQPCPRIVLIDSHGVGYQAVSLGVYSAVRKMLDTYGVVGSDGVKRFTKPKKFKVVQITKGDRKLLTLNPVIAKKK